jgi:hypothetical protein
MVHDYEQSAQYQARLSQINDELKKTQTRKNLINELTEALDLTNKMMFGLDSENKYIDVFSHNR